MINSNTKKAQQATGAARLRIEMHTPTRIVRRVIDVSMATKLPKLASIIRTARGWVTSRPYEFRVNGQTYRERAGAHPNGCLSVHGRQLGDVLARIMREGVVLGETQEPPCGTNVVSTSV